MYQQDFIMRMIEQFTQVLARVIGLKEQKKYNDALEMIDHSLTGQLKLPANWPFNLELSELSQQIQEELPENADHWRVTSSLLYERTEVLVLMHDREGARKLSEALVIILTELINAPEQVFSLENHTRLENVLFRLRQHPLQEFTYLRIVWHYQRQHKFAIAEDWLFEALDLSENKQQLLDVGRAFYNDLKDRSDEQLSRGGLPREEVKAGLEDLDRYAQSNA